MTRAYDGLVTCPHCGRVHTAETAFERWLRNQPALDSVDAGVVRFDCDVLLHRYKVAIDKKSTRLLQCLMFVEVKTHDAEPSRAQRDTLSLMAQVVRNRRRNMHRDRRGRHLAQHDALAVAFSWLQGRAVRLKMFGGHLLQLSGDDPATSDTIRWDRRVITVDDLVQLLRFERDPDTLQLVDWRRRYSDFTRSDMFSEAM